MAPYGHPATNASWKQRKSKMSQTGSGSQSQAYGSPATKLFWKQRKSNMSSVPLPSQSG